MDNAQNFYVYNPLQQNKDIGRRTGKPIHKKRNICNENDNFDDYLTDSDDDESINITKSGELPGSKTTELSQTHDPTSSAMKNGVTQRRESCSQTDLTIENISHLLPEKFGDVIVVNPLAAGSRFGRRTGKDLLACKKKTLANGVENFSDYLTDSSDVSVSLQATPSVCSGGKSTLSPSTSAKESDGNYSPKKSKERKDVFSPLSMQESCKSVRTEKLTVVSTPKNEDFGISFKERDKNLSIGTSLVSQIAQMRDVVHESYVNENTKNTKLVFSNEHAQNMPTPDVRIVPHIIEKAASTELGCEGLQTQCLVEGSAAVSNKSTLIFDNGSNRNNLNSPELRKHNQSDVEQARVHLSMPKMVESYPEKENVIPNSSLQGGRVSTTEQVQDRANDNNDRNSSADKIRTVVNQGTLQEESSEHTSFKERYVPVNVPVPETHYPVEVRCLVVDRDKKIQAEKSQHANAELQQNKNYTSSVPEKSKIVSETKDSAQKTVCEVRAPISSVNADIHSVDQSDHSTKTYQTIDVKSQSGTSGSLTKSATGTLNFAGDVIGSVSTSEKATSGQFFGIKKRLSYSAALERDQQNEKTKKSAETKGTKQIIKSVGSFLEHHTKVNKDLPNTVSGVSTFIIRAPRRVSQLISDEPLSSSLNTSTDSSDEFRIVEEDIKEPNLSRVDKRNSETGARKLRHKEKYETFPATHTISKRGRNIISETDSRESINEHSAMQGNSIHKGNNRITEQLSKKKQHITKSKGSFLDHYDQANTDHPDTVLGTGTFVSLAPRRVSQLVIDEPPSSLNTSMDSIDCLQIVEEEIKKPKQSNTNKRNKKNASKSMVQHSEKDETSPAKQMKIDKGERDMHETVKGKQINNESVNHKNSKVLRHKRTKRNKLMKKVKRVVCVNMDENEAVDVDNNSEGQHSSLQDVHKKNKKVKEKSNSLAKEGYVEDSINVNSIKQLKKSKKVPDLMGLHNLSKSLVVDHEHYNNDIDTTGVNENNSSVRRSGRERYSVPPVQYPFAKSARKHKKPAAVVKRVAVDTNKNQKLEKSRRNKISKTRQNHKRVKKLKTRTGANVQANSEQQKRNNCSSVDRIDANTTEHGYDYISILSNNTSNNNTKTIISNGEQNMYLDISWTEQIPGKKSIDNGAESQECVLKKSNNQQSSLKELKVNCSRTDFLDVSVPVKLSTGKKTVDTKKSASHSKRKSFKASVGKRKSTLNSEEHDESTPLKLQLLSSLPNVTPQSGISFRRTQSFTSTFNDAAGLSPAAELMSKALNDKEYSTPRRKQQEEPVVLSSCLKNSDCVRPRKNKLRRVRISSIIDQKEMSPAETQTSDCGTDINTTSLPSPSCSPVHYRDTTTNNVYSNQKSPKIILPDLSYKIVRPEANSVQGLRRSSRTKVMRLNSHKGEEIIYRRDSSGFGLVVDSIQPSIGEARVKAAEEKRRRKLKEAKLKAMNVPAKPKKRLSTHWTVSDEITSSTEIPVVNPENNEEVLLELIARQDSATWYGPDLAPVIGTEPVALCLHLQQPMFTTGELHMRPLAEKPLQLTASTLIFTVIYGKIHLRINDVSSIVETGDHFFIPRGTLYAFKNLRREIAKLNFVDVNDANNN